jgi:hypothetical protein
MMTATLWLLLWLLGPQSTASSIQGVVVRAGTSQPLAGEVVGLWPTTRSVKTDAEGKYLFRSVEPGEYALTVVRDGIKLQVPVVITRVVRVETVTLEVKPPPAIIGTVFDPSGERLAGAHVQAFRTVHTTQGPRIRSVMSVPTDDLGEFRLFWLRPGEYYVAAGSSDREQRLATLGLRLSPNLSKPDEGFPTLFFGGAYSASESQRVRLGKDADASGIQVFLKDGPRYSIDVVLIPEGICARVAIAQDGGFLNTDANAAPKACGSFRISGRSRGTYSILATNDQFASDIVRVSTVNPVTAVKVPMVNTYNITGRLSRDGPAGLTGINVKLSRSSAEVSQEIETSVAADGTFTFPSVGVGSYEVSVQPLPERLFVRTASYRAADALFYPITVDSSFAGRLDIQLTQSNITAEGVVVDRAGRPSPGAEVVLIPRDIRSRRRADRYFAARADGAGGFRINGIPSADYVLLAFEEIEPGAYYAFAYDGALFNRYATNAPTLIAASANPLRLVAIPADETAGGLR